MAGKKGSDEKRSRRRRRKGKKSRGRTDGFQRKKKLSTLQEEGIGSSREGGVENSTRILTKRAYAAKLQVLGGGRRQTMPGEGQANLEKSGKEF